MKNFLCEIICTIHVPIDLRIKVMKNFYPFIHIFSSEKPKFEEELYKRVLSFEEDRVIKKYWEV